MHAKSNQNQKDQNTNLKDYLRRTRMKKHRILSQLEQFSAYTKKKSQARKRNIFQWYSY